MLRWKFLLLYKLQFLRKLLYLLYFRTLLQLKQKVSIKKIDYIKIKNNFTSWCFVRYHCRKWSIGSICSSLNFKKVYIIWFQIFNNKFVNISDNSFNGPISISFSCVICVKNNISCTTKSMFFVRFVICI